MRFRCRQYIGRCTQQLTVSHGSQTVPQKYELRPLELVLRHKRLEPNRHKRPHLPREVLRRAQEQIHSAGQVRVRRGRHSHWLPGLHDMLYELIGGSIYDISHARCGYVASVAVELDSQRIELPIIGIRESVHRRSRHG